MSAVDLFASTLGAFVVLTMILLPLRSQEPPVPSPADPDAAEVREALRTARGMLDQARDRVSELEASGTATAEAMGAARERVAELEALLAVAREALEQRVSATASSPQTASAPEAPLGAIDLVVVLDTTASMWAVIESLSADIAAVGAVLVALTADPAVAIIDFKDGCGGVPALRLTPLQPARRSGALSDSGVHRQHVRVFRPVQHDSRRGSRRGPLCRRRRALAAPCRLPGGRPRQ